MREIIKTKLKKSQPIPELDAELFYVRNLNLHRCILVADRSERQEISPEEIRQIVCKHQPASWFRGMGFGAVLAVTRMADAIAGFDAAIDIRARRRGTWQWSIVYSPTDRICVGCHTWTRGYTTGLFQDLLRRFKADGYCVTDRKAQMSAFLSFATKWTVHGRLIPQYTEIFPEQGEGRSSLGMP